MDCGEPTARMLVRPCRPDGRAGRRHARRAVRRGIPREHNGEVLSAECNLVGKSAITAITKVPSRLRHGGELHPRRQESRLVGSSVGAGACARFEGLSSDVFRLSVERECHPCPGEQWPGGNVAEHGGAVLPVMAERHHPCCHTHPGAPLGVGNAPRVTCVGPVGTWVGGGAARAREWAIILAVSEMVGNAWHSAAVTIPPRWRVQFLQTDLTSFGSAFPPNGITPTSVPGVLR